MSLVFTIGCKVTKQELFSKPHPSFPVPALQIIYDDEYIYIDYFKAFNNEYNIEIAGKYNLKNNFANIQAIVEIEKEKIFEINTLGNLDNPEIKVLSSDKSIDMSFNINDINQILSGNFEDVFQNLLSNE